MKNLTLYRKRLIPMECIELKDDVILHCDKDVIITKWKTLKPRKDMDHGYSAYFLNEGFKVSKFYRADGSLLYWYCDIVDYSFTDNDSVCISTDLLVDIIIHPDASVQILDLDELVTASKTGILSEDLLHTALIRADNLLKIIYGGEFHKYQSVIETEEC